MATDENTPPAPQWLALNEAVLLDHWNGLTDGVQLGQQQRRLL